MRFAIVFSFLVVAGNCAEKALGTEPQALFSAPALWLWWIPASVFAVNGIIILFRGVSA